MESISKVIVKLLYTHFLLLVSLAAVSEAIVKPYQWCYTFATGERVEGTVVGEIGGNWDAYYYPEYPDFWADPTDSNHIAIYRAWFNLYLADGTFAASAAADDLSLYPEGFAPQALPRDGNRDGLDVRFEMDTDQAPAVYFYCSPRGTGIALWDWETDQVWSVREEGNAGWRLLNPERIPETGFTLSLLAVAIAAVAIGHRRRRS